MINANNSRGSYVIDREKNSSISRANVVIFKPDWPHSMLVDGSDLIANKTSANDLELSNEVDFDAAWTWDKRQKIYNELYKNGNKNNIPCLQAYASVSIMDGENKIDVSKLAPVIAVCGIGDPLSFKYVLSRNNVMVKELITYKDHHNYTDSDGESLVRQMKATGCDSIITTSKDYEKLRLLNLKNIKIVILKMDFSIDRPSELMSLIKGRLEIDHEA